MADLREMTHQIQPTSTKGTGRSHESVPERLKEVPDTDYNPEVLQQSDQHPFPPVRTSQRVEKYQEEEEEALPSLSTLQQLNYKSASKKSLCEGH